MRIARITLLLFVIQTFGLGQIKRDPVMVSLGGAYTTLADGVHAVGVNPANLAFQHDKPFMWQLATVNFGLGNNFFSMENLAAFSGKDLESQGKKGKNQLYDQLRDGFRIFGDAHVAPLLSYASGNMAITNDLVGVFDLVLPEGLVQLLLEGNEVGVPIDLEYNRESMLVSEHAFSFAVPMKDFSWGVSLKYLNGLVYTGIDPDSSFTEFTTTPTDFNLHARYFLRQGIGGSGVAMDLGLVSKEFNGMRVGFSFINAFGTIEWNGPSAFQVPELLINSLPGIVQEGDEWGASVVSKGDGLIYEIEADSITINKLSNGQWSDLFKEKKYIIKDTLENGQPRKFKMRYPGLFRIGVSKRLGQDLIIASDLVAGSEDRFGVHQGWKLSTGLQFNRFKAFPLRLGYMYGGRFVKELGFGGGFHAGPIIFDYALSFRNGTWIHSMKGFSFSFGVAITSFKSRKDKAPPSQ